MVTIVDNPRRGPNSEDSLKAHVTRFAANLLSGFTCDVVALRSNISNNVSLLIARFVTGKVVKTTRDSK